MYLEECVIIQKEQTHEIIKKMHLFIRVKSYIFLATAKDNRGALEEILH